jgi:hypothetical protein
MASSLPSSGLSSSHSSEIDSEVETENSTNSGEGSIAIHLIPKKNTTSKVWTYYGFRVHNETGHPIDKDSPTCKLCFSNVSARRGNTSNLLSHLQLHHPKEYTEVRQAQSESFTKSKSSKAAEPNGQQTLE